MTTYVLKGIPNWFSKNNNIITIENIFSLTFGKRLFRLFDQNYPYQLNVQMKSVERCELCEATNILKLGPCYGDLFYISRRYKTEDEMRKDVRALLYNQKKVK